MHIVEEIEGYEVTVSDQLTDSIDCWVMCKKTRASASLACLMDTGALSMPGTFDDVLLPQDVIDEIEAFAEENGY